MVAEMVAEKRRGLWVTMCGGIKLRQVWLINLWAGCRVMIDL